MVRRRGRRRPPGRCHPIGRRAWEDGRIAIDHGPDTDLIPRRPALGDRLRAEARNVAVASVIGILTGIIVGGVGGRLAMRAIAATSDPALKGVFTSDREPVGEITIGGTVALVLFVGVLGGILLGLAYLVLRDLLPGDRLLRAAAAAVLVWCVGAASMFDAADFDFRVLEPRWLAVVMFSAIFLAAGWVTAAWIEVALLRWPAPSRSSWWRYAPLVLVAPFFPLLALLVGITALRSVDWGRWRGLVGPVQLAGRAALVALAVVLAVPAVGEVLDII